MYDRQHYASVQNKTISQGKQTEVFNTTLSSQYDAVFIKANAELFSCSTPKGNLTQPK